MMNRLVQAQTSILMESAYPQSATAEHPKINPGRLTAGKLFVTSSLDQMGVSGGFPSWPSLHDDGPTGC